MISVMRASAITCTFEGNAVPDCWRSRQHTPRTKAPATTTHPAPRSSAGRLRTARTLDFAEHPRPRLVPESLRGSGIPQQSQLLLRRGKVGRIEMLDEFCPARFQQ